MSNEKYVFQYNCIYFKHVDWSYDEAFIYNGLDLKEAFMSFYETFDVCSQDLEVGFYNSHSRLDDPKRFRLITCSRFPY